MSYDAYESSIESGRPLYLYQFTLGATIWRYTSADSPVQANGFVWNPVAISDDGIAQSGEPSSDSLTITAPFNVGPAEMFVGAPPSRPIQVAILHKHEDDPQAIVCYSGEVSQVDYGAPGVVQIICITTSATMQRDGLRLGWQRMCPYALYDPRTCKVNKAAYATQAEIAVVHGDGHVTLSNDGGRAHPAFAGGFMEWTDPVRGLTTVMIEDHNGTLFRMFGSTALMTVGLQVTLYPGCARTTDACASFENSLNYGGCAYMPGKSPFDGTPVF